MEVLGTAILLVPVAIAWCLVEVTAVPHILLYGEGSIYSPVALYALVFSLTTTSQALGLAASPPPTLVVPYSIHDASLPLPLPVSFGPLLTQFE